MTAPAVYLTNAATVSAVLRARAQGKPPAASSVGCVGPGRVLTIMAEPRAKYGEAGVGRVDLLRPSQELRDGLRAKTITGAEYRDRFTATIRAHLPALAPGALLAHIYATGEPSPVADGDTLICACSRDAALEDGCHRCWSARALADAGWRVVLDGRVLGGGAVG